MSPFPRILVFVTILFPRVISYRDDTFVEFASGRDITEIVIRIIRLSEIFREDYSFLLRMANVESRFGLRNQTFRPDYFGGIWQVDKDKFETTKDLQNGTISPILEELHKKIFFSFGIMWSTVEWSDLVKPLYSGLAARIYLSLGGVLIGDGIDSIPDTIKKQAYLWATLFHPEVEDLGLYIQESVTLQETHKVCTQRMDLVVGIDGSTSVTYENFQILRENVGESLQKIFRFGLENTRIGIFLWSNRAYSIHSLKDGHLSAEQVGNIVKRIDYPFGDTRVDLALTHGLFEMTNATQRTGVPQVILLFMEGQSDSPFINVVEELKNENISVIIVGIGSDINLEELLNISMGNQRHAFSIAGFNSLPDFFLDLSDVLCSIPQKPLYIGESYTDTLRYEEMRTYVLEIESEEGITIFIYVENEDGSASGYWCYDFDIPQLRIHDGEIDDDGRTFIPAETESEDYIRVGRRPPNRARKVYQQRAYLTIQGLTNLTTYKIYIQEGDHDFKETEGSTGSHGRSSFMIIILISHLILVSFSN